MRIFKNILFASMIFFGLQLWAQQTPAPAQSETIILKGDGEAALVGQNTLPDMPMHLTFFASVSLTP